MIKAIPTKLSDPGMEHLLELDQKCADGVIKDLIGYLAWNELLVDWDNGEALVKLHIKFTIEIPLFLQNCIRQ